MFAKTQLTKRTNNYRVDRREEGESAGTTRGGMQTNQFSFEEISYLPANNKNSQKSTIMDIIFLRYIFKRATDGNESGKRDRFPIRFQ